MDGTDYRVVVEVPGGVKDGMEVGPGPLPGTLLVRVPVHEARKGSPLRLERAASAAGRERHERVVPVAWDADVAKAKATLENGLLTVTVPRQGGRPDEREKEKEKR